MGRMRKPKQAWQVTFAVLALRRASQSKLAKSEQSINVSAETTKTLTVKMEIGGLEENLVVTVSSPTVDTTTSTISTTFDSNMLSKLPSGRDAFYDLDLTAPGISDVGSDESWLPRPATYASATNENVFHINGFNITNPRGTSWGSIVNVNYNKVQENRVLSLGTKAEYGNFSGAAIDVITQSGGNEFHSNAVHYSLLKSWNNQPSGTVRSTLKMAMSSLPRPTRIGKPTSPSEVQFSIDKAKSREAIRRQRTFQSADGLISIKSRLPNRAHRLQGAQPTSPDLRAKAKSSLRLPQLHEPS